MTGKRYLGEVVCDSSRKPHPYSDGYCNNPRRAVRADYVTALQDVLKNSAIEAANWIAKIKKRR